MDEIQNALDALATIGSYEDEVAANNATTAYKAQIERIAGLEVRIARLESALRSIERNAPQSEPPRQFNEEWTPKRADAAAWAFWQAGEIARAVLADVE